MVLQEFDSSSETTDNSDPSSNDSYTRSSSGSRFDADSLAQPLPIIGILLGYKRRAVWLANLNIDMAQQKVRRPLSRDESQAFAEHIFKMNQTTSYYTTGGLALGTYRWWKTWDSFALVGMTPKPEAVPQTIFSLKGPQARMLLQGSRLTLYLTVGGLLGNLIGNVASQATATLRTREDARLVQYWMDKKRIIEQQKAQGMTDQDIMREDSKRTLEAAWKSLPGGRRPEQGTASARVPQTPPPSAPWTQRSSSSMDDDMSPTAGNEPWPSEGSKDAWGSSGFPLESPTANPPQPRRQQNSDDEASPTGGLFNDEVQSRSKPGESAWERLRRGGVPPMQQQQPPRREQRDEGFGFREEGAERERAQREFDARIDREKQGRDFDEERRW